MEFSDDNLKPSSQRAPGKTFSCILLTYVGIAMKNYFKLDYFNLFLKLFYYIISSFLYFRMISEQNVWQIHVDGAHSYSVLRFVV